MGKPTVQGMKFAKAGMDSHGVYVALLRHRDGVDLHYGREDFADRDKLAMTPSRIARSAAGGSATRALGTKKQEA